VLRGGLSYTCPVEDFSSIKECYISGNWRVQPHKACEKAAKKKDVDSGDIGDPTGGNASSTGPVNARQPGQGTQEFGLEITTGRRPPERVTSSRDLPHIVRP
jgi:hypothetical protein